MAILSTSERQRSVQKIREILIFLILRKNAFITMIEKNTTFSSDFAPKTSISVLQYIYKINKASIP